MAAGPAPARLRFLVRNRTIAALIGGTVIIEAGERSGALNTARHAADLGRPLMAVPGPVTSAQSAGCHRIIRDWGATCVTCAADVIEMLAPLGTADPRAPGRLGAADGGASESAPSATTSTRTAPGSSTRSPLAAPPGPPRSPSKPA